MKQRSLFELCLPLAVFAAACALSTTALVIALAWLTLGVCSIGHRRPDQFPVDGIPSRWLHDNRSAFVWFYRIACWPRYVRNELEEIAARISTALHAARLWPHRDRSL
jgi:hypothetical protein